MTDNFIMLNNKKYELDEIILNEIIKKPTKLKVKSSVFDRCNYSGMYYYIDSSTGKVELKEEGYNHIVDENNYKTANYCKDKELLQQQAYWETLNRLLWRFSKVHDDAEYDKTWNNSYRHWYIYIDKKYQEVRISWSIEVKCFNTIYFSSYALASEAIAKVVIPFMAQNPNFNLFEDPEKR